jgi:hypothetical protein
MSRCRPRPSRFSRLRSDWQPAQRLEYNPSGITRDPLRTDLYAIDPQSGHLQRALIHVNLPITYYLW